jgi:hypothetical protein
LMQHEAPDRHSRALTLAIADIADGSSLEGISF